jgi:hypothetical protein
MALLGREMNGLQIVSAEADTKTPRNSPFFPSPFRWAVGVLGVGHGFG